MSSAFTLLLTFSSLTAALPRDNLDTVTSAALDRRYNVERPEPHPVEDPSILKYQVSGIVGAYVLWALVTVILIIIVRRRLKRRANLSEHQVTYTMLKTFHGKRVAPIAIETAEIKGPESMKSPSKMQGFKSWGRKSNKNLSATYSTATVNSTQSHEQHKAQDMDDLSKLYAAVIARDEERSVGGSPTSPEEKFPLSPGYPPEFAHLHATNIDREPLRSPGFSQPLKSPGFSQPLKSPGFGQSLHHPLAPTPTVDAFPTASPYYDPNISRNSSRSNRTTPMSINSETGSIAASLSSPRQKPTNIAIRGQNISQPIGSADLRNAQYYDETVPLSPRLYNPGPPPPIPGNKKKQVQVSIEPIDEDSPTDEYPYYQQESTQQSQVTSLPRSIAPSAQTNTTQQPVREKRGPPSSLALRSNDFAPASAAAPGGRALPFRDMYGDSALRSAPPTKTTFLERPTVPNAAPRTGVPYSPYMPNTPMTPITPRRLMNRQELRARRKEEKLKPLQEDDMVAGDGDMWGS